MDDLVTPVVATALASRIGKDIERQRLIGMLRTDSRLEGYQPALGCIDVLSQHPWMSSSDVNAFETRYYSLGS